MKRLQRQGNRRGYVTRLSRGERGSRAIAGILQLAWRSLSLLSIMLFAESCIVADPPEYRAPGQTRPLLDVYGAVPPATRVLVVDKHASNVIQFNVSVQSEDAGEDLRAVFFLDYGTAGELRLVGQTISASTYDNTARAAKLPWRPISVSDGCHFVTLVVAHVNSFQPNNDDHLDLTKAGDDASLVSWTVNVNPSSDAPNTLANCPSPVVPSVGQ